MIVFFIVTAFYLTISGGLCVLMMEMNKERRKVFTDQFGKGRSMEDLSGCERQDWTELHTEKFGTGFWRRAFMTYTFYHYPGFLLSLAVSTFFRSKVLNGWMLVVSSAIVWIAMIYFLIVGLDT